MEHIIDLSRYSYPVRRPTNVSTADPALRSLPLFANLSNTAFERLLCLARSIDLDAGEAIESASAGRFCLLAAGRLCIEQTTNEGLRHIARYLVPGDVFDLSRHGPAGMATQAIAAADCRILVWDADVWANLLEHDVVLANNAMRAMARVLDDAQDRMREIATQDVEQRLANAMLRLVERSSEPVGAGRMIDFPITRKDFADLVGATHTTVSRIVSAWQVQGVLRRRGLKLIVTDLVRLRDLADGLDKDSPDRFVNRRARQRLAHA